MDDTRKIVNAEAVPDAEATQESHADDTRDWKRSTDMALFLSLPEADRQFFVGYAAGRVAAYGGRTTA